MYKDIQIDVNNIDTNLTVLRETDNSITVNEATGSTNNSVTDDCVEDTEDSIPVNQEKSSFQNEINDLNDLNDNNEEIEDPLNEHRMPINQTCLQSQGPTLRLTGRQCDQKLSVGDQKFRTGRQQATNLFSPRHLRFQGKWAFFRRKHKAAVDNCSKTKRRSYDHHIYSAPYCFSGFSQF